MTIAIPSVEDLRLAAHWCSYNEGSDGESEAVSRVAEWLEQQADAKEMREAAREHRIPVSKLREWAASSDNPANYPAEVPA